MIIEPAIDKLIDKVGGCKYKLVTVISKRTRQLVTQESLKEYVAESKMKPLTLAAHEVIEGKIRVEDE